MGHRQRSEIKSDGAVGLRTRSQRTGPGRSALPGPFVAYTQSGSTSYSRGMPSTSEADILSRALSLPAPDRARLVRELICSLDEAEDPDAADAWLAEIERRAREVKGGTAELEEWPAVRERLARRWSKR